METEAQAAASELEAQLPAGSPPESDLSSELSALQALADERYRDLQFARADIENVRKRALRAAEDRQAHARRALLAKFLPVLDNLQRALAFEDGEGLRGGLNATLKGFESVLSSEQIVTLDTVGKPFDPHEAEAIAIRETSDLDDDIVVEEVQRGYRLGEDVLRPALVIVSKRVAP